MGSLPLDTMTMAETPAARRWPLSRARGLRLLALGAILALAAGLRFANLDALGYANHYYTAGVASMLQSWHNFFFVAAEPGGSVSIDKPPVGLWLQAISAFFLGVNGFAMVLPEILSGLASIAVLYHLVRRSFGTAAGLLAALALAITPIVIATDRNNTIDSSLILTLLLATWAFIKATESGRLRWLLLGALLVGIGFNIKMLQAYLVLPALYGLYFLGAKVKMWRKLGQLTLASALLLVVSFSWITVVDLTPADQRPYVGSSTDNSELSLALGYNGLERLVGMRGSLSSFISRLTGGAANTGGFQPQGGGNLPNGNFRPFGNSGNLPNGNFRPFGNGGRGNFPQGGGAGGNFQPGNFAAGGPGGGGGGFPGTGTPGPLRLFATPLSKEVSWLLPFGLFSLALLLLGGRLTWPLDPKRQAAVVWGGWLLTGVVFFSVAGFFHEYYLSMLAAPLAALVGIGIVQLWRMRAAHPWLSITLLLAAAAGTLALQLRTATAYVGFTWWLAAPVALLGLAAVVLLASTDGRRRLAAATGTMMVAGAMLFTPGVWSGLTTFNSSANQSLPAAYAGRESNPFNGGGEQVNTALVAYLQANTQNTKYLMAVPSSMQGADYVIATGQPVLYLGGFNGQDPVESADDLAQLVASGQLRYIYWGGQGGGRGNFSRGSGDSGTTSVSQWVTSQCMLVQGFGTTTQNAGAPDGTGGNQGATGNGVGGRDILVNLYDCAAQ